MTTHLRSGRSDAHRPPAPGSLALAGVVLLCGLLVAGCTPPETERSGGGESRPAASGATSTSALSATSAASPSGPATSPDTGAPASAPTTGTLTVMVHDSFNASEKVVQKFEANHHVALRFLKAGDAGEALTKAILAKDAPLADLLYGVDNTFLGRALKEDIFVPYDAPGLDQIAEEFDLDKTHHALPVDFGDVCLNYDRAYFAAKQTKPPASLEDLTKPAYKNLLVVENPATSSPGLAFLLATIGHFGEGAYLSYWKQLRANGVNVVSDWESAYNREFSGSAGKGPRPIVVSYGSSPPFEVIYAPTPPAEPPTAALVADGTCFRQVEFVGILRGTKQRALAEAWVDYMLSLNFQEDMPLQMYVFPVHRGAELDRRFQRYMSVPKVTASVAPEAIAAKREKWIEAWTDAVLR